MPNLVVSPRSYGAKGNGVANDAVALQKALDSNARAVELDGTFGTTACINVPPGKSIYGFGEKSIIKALPGFPQTLNAGPGYGRVPAPILWRDGRVVVDKHDVYRDFRLNGDDIAQVGLLLTIGAQLTISSVHVGRVKEVGIVADGLQNSCMDSCLSHRSGRWNFALINGAAAVTLTGLMCRYADECNVFVGKDARFPAAAVTDLNAGRPVDCQFLCGVWESHYQSASRTHSLYMDECDRILIQKVETVGTSKLTRASIEIGPLAGLCKIADGGLQSNKQDNVPSIINRGYRTVVEDCSFINWGGGRLESLIESHNALALIRPHEGGCVYSGPRVNVVAGTLKQDLWG